MSRSCDFSRIFVLLAAATLLSAQSTARAADELDSLVAVVASPDSTWEDRAAAERGLEKVSRETLLPKLVGVLRDRPDGPKYVEPENPEADKDAPPAWLAYFATRRAWRKASADLPFTPDVATLVTDLLPLAQTSEARAQAAKLVEEHWSPRAEETLANWLRDPRQSTDVRAAAARTLYQQLRQRYEREIIGIADAGGIELQAEVFAMITDALPPWPDPVVVQMGFRLLLRAEGQPEPIPTAHSVAKRLGAYIGQPFDPGPADANEKPADRARRERETVRKAEEWWKANGKRIQQDAAKRRPRDA